MKKSVFGKWTSKAAGMIEKMTERTACAGYCNTASGILFTDKVGCCLYKLPGADTREETPEESAAATAAEEAETATLDPFFFPAPVADQLVALPVGEVVTVYRADEWILQNSSFCGVLVSAEPGKYAQYSGIYLNLRRNRKTVRIFCRDGLETVVFSGLPCALPDSVKYASVKASGGATIAECRSQGDELRQIIRFYAEMGRKPIFDTVQR